MTELQIRKTAKEKSLKFYGWNNSYANTFEDAYIEAGKDIMKDVIKWLTENVSATVANEYAQAMN